MTKQLLFFLFLSLSAQAQIADFKDVDFSKADSIAMLYKGEGLENLPLLSYKLCHQLTSDVEKFRAIYLWVSTNIESDHSFYLKNKAKREKLRNNPIALEEWNRSFQPKVFDRLLKDKKTVCTGYAYLVKELAFFASIECRIIDGYGRTVVSNIGGEGIPNHSWNAVRLNGQWYLCDATWSAGYYDVAENQFVFDYNNGYFLANPELFAKSHYPLNTDWLLTKKAASLNAFLNAPLVYKGSFNHGIIPVAPNIMHLHIVKKETITFLFQTIKPVPIDAIRLVIVSGSNSQTVVPEIIQNQDGLGLKYRFEHLGHYDIHVKIAEDVVATYTTRVHKKSTK